MLRKFGVTLAIIAAAGVAVASTAGAKPEDDDIGRDLISIATPGRHATIAKTADCIVWANAEGLGVGPAQLGGLHGIVMHINPRPLPEDGAPVSFAAGLARLKAEHPTAPAWMVALLQKNQAVIEARCAEDHPDPLKIYSIKARDRSAR